MKLAMEKTFVSFGLLFLVSIPLAMMGMIPELLTYALVAVTVLGAVGYVVATEESA